MRFAIPCSLALFCSLLAACSMAGATPAASPPSQSPDDPDAKVTDQKVGYVVGMRMSYQPEFMGASDYRSSVRPVISLQWGKWRLSSSGASAVMGFGRDIQGSGASTDLLSLDRVRVSLSLRFDNGRHSADSARLQGLPDIRRTLRAQLSTRYSLSDDWQFGGTMSIDMLGHGGGTMAGLGVSHRLHREAKKSEWTVGGGLGWGNQRYQRSNFGVAAEVAPKTHFAAYEPRGGLRDAYVGAGWTYAITHHWIAYSSLSASRLIGPSAGSPLVERRNAAQFAFGLAYRNR